MAEGDRAAAEGRHLGALLREAVEADPALRGQADPGRLDALFDPLAACLAGPRLAAPRAEHARLRASPSFDHGPR